MHPHKGMKKRQPAHPDRSHKPPTGAGHIDGPGFTAKTTDKGPPPIKKKIGSGKRKV
jgi:hypothetical protein